MLDWIHEAAVQVRNALPVSLAFWGDVSGIFTLDGTIKVLGFVYLVLQIGYLAWKWRREARNADR